MKKGIVTMIDSVGGIFIYTLGGQVYRTNALHYPDLTLNTEVEFDNPEFDYATNVRVVGKTQLEIILEKLDGIESDLRFLIDTLTEPKMNRDSVVAQFKAVAAQAAKDINEAG